MDNDGRCLKCKLTRNLLASGWCFECEDRAPDRRAMKRIITEAEFLRSDAPAEMDAILEIAREALASEPESALVGENLRDAAQEAFDDLRRLEVARDGDYARPDEDVIAALDRALLATHAKPPENELTRFATWKALVDYVEARGFMVVPAQTHTGTGESE